MVKKSAGEVFLVKTRDRQEGIKKIFENFSMTDFKDKTVAFKANFNSADPFPASNHIQTLQTILEELKSAKSGKIVLAERSGMGKTSEVLEKMGVYDLSQN